jgi:hypothetical protein
MPTDRTTDRHEEAHMHSSLFMQLHLKTVFLPCVHWQLILSAVLLSCILRKLLTTIKFNIDFAVSYNLF